MRLLVLAAFLGGCRIADAFDWNTEGRLFPALPIAATSAADERCRSESELLVRSLANDTLWAAKMWDSSAKAPVGLLYGSTYQMGNFDECLSVTSPVVAQFCMVDITAKLPGGSLRGDPFALEPDPTETAWASVEASRIDPSKVPRDSIRWGLCVPASCSVRDLEHGLDEYLSGLNASVGYVARVRSEFCTRSGEGDDVGIGEIAFWFAAIALIALAASATVADHFLDAKGDSTTLRRLWMAFSAKRNSLRLTGSSAESESAAGAHLDILHGIKALSIVSIVIGHRVGISLSVSASNFREIEAHLRSESSLFFVHTDLVVDTFFFVSGLLACFFLVSAFAAKSVNPLYAILVRLLRLGPAYFFVVWYQAAAASRFGSGPLWKAMAKGENDFCARNWWTNLLFVSNYVKPEEMCMTHSWYIPCDFHFFVLATLLAGLLVKRRALGIALLGLLTVASAVVPAAVTYVNRIQPMIIFYHDFLSMPRGSDSFNTLYVKSHNRATVYLIGMAVGLFLHSRKDSAKRAPMKYTFAAFFAWLLFMFAPMVYGGLYYDAGRPYDAVESAIFASARRILWATGFAIFVLAHRFRSLPVLTRALSSRPAFFLSNITYGIYLLHFNLISADVFQIRAARPFRIGDVLLEGVGDVLVSGFFAVVLFLVLEVPVKRIVREVLLSNAFDAPVPEPDALNNNNNKGDVPVDVPALCTVKL